MLSFFKSGSVYNSASSHSSDVLDATSASLSVTVSLLLSSRFTTVAPVNLLPTFTVILVSSSVSSTDSSSASSSSVNQPNGFYSWSTFSSSTSVADYVGVLFENDSRQRERKLSDEDKVCCCVVNIGCLQKSLNGHTVKSRASNPSDYYRRAIRYPYLDSILMSMNDKFSSHHLTVLKLHGCSGTLYY
jgi:hypothetical protein